MHCLALSSSKQRPEQMPVDRDEQGGAEPAALAGTGAPAAAPGGRWALGTGAAKKCQGLHPGNSHSHAWRCGSPPAEGNAGKIAGKEGAEYSMEARSARQPRTLRGSNAAAPPRLLLSDGLRVLAFYRAKKQTCCFPDLESCPLSMG